MLAAEWTRIIKQMAESVKESRRLLGWSQQKLADLAVTSQGAISRIESGKCESIPFHSVVIITRTLAPGLAESMTRLSPQTMSLLNFTLDGVPLANESINPDLMYFASVLHGLNASQQKTFMRVVRAVSDLMEAAS